MDGQNPPTPDRSTELVALSAFRRRGLTINHRLARCKQDVNKRNNHQLRPHPSLD